MKTISFFFDCGASRKLAQGTSLVLVLLMVAAVPLAAQSRMGNTAVGEAPFTDTFGDEEREKSEETPDPADESADEPGDDEFDEFSEFDEFEEGGSEQAVFDPLGGYNRVMTQVNDRLYYLVLKPAAQGYRLVVAKPARKSISHFFTNLGFPVRFVNNLLQLKVERAATEVVRFVVNSSIGVVGLWDPATKIMELPLYQEDFGQTLGHYGLGGGFPVVLPLLGPSNLRDACAKVVDRPLSPVSYIDDNEAELIFRAVGTVNGTSLRIGQYEAMTEDAVDLYILLRQAYQQNRDKQIKE
ncbi:MAG: VacJ family lipoprotein [Desulfosudaceae bacterium]